MLTLAGSLGSSCGKKSASTPDDAKDVLIALDNAEGNEGPKQPIAGVDLGDFSEEQKTQFDKLVDSLVSPCGKAMSLRKSTQTAADCRRALFAARYIAFLVGEAASDSEIRELYGDRYVDKKVHTFELKNTPHTGAADAKVAIVEFFDFSCPACRASIPILRELVGQFEGDVVLYYKQFPLEGHAHSVGAAQAAIAAHQQGKYVEMHETLLTHPDRQTRDDLFEHARALGLDMNKFATDYAAADPIVLADKKEGILAGVDGTPTFFINGRQYNDPIMPNLLEMWLEEEIAITR